MPNVSVIIPTYNRAKLLPRAVKSVLAQTLQDFEVFVIDDGSTDNTQALVEEFQKKDERIQYIRISHTGGAAAPKNRGIREAKGAYIATLDADDEWLSEKLTKQVKVMEKSDISFAGCDFLIVENGNATPYYVPQYHNILDHLLAVDYMGPGSCMIYRKEVFERIGGFDENLKSGQDKEMRLRLITNGYFIGWVSEVLVKYYREADSIGVTHLNLTERERDWNYVFEKYRAYYEAKPNVWSNKFRYEGTRYALIGERKKAWKSFLFSLQKNPFNWRSIVYLALSFFGKRVYTAATKWKLKTKASFR